MNAELIQTLKDFFAAKDTVILALVYGSQVTEWYKPDSDVDIAVHEYFRLNLEILYKIVTEEMECFSEFSKIIFALCNGAD